MEYQVTATRRRPQKFEDLLGQEFVAATLQKSIEAGKIAHAYLFSGPRGCGKTSSARILAKALNCAAGPTPTPCGTCTSCEEITLGSCLDVIEIDGASNTGVNDVRQIKDEILFPPNSNRYKIYIIDEVHMLSTSAFNALLKTIEEPPPYVVFIFATTEIHKVPATIKSRCQQFNFKLVPIEILKTALAEAAAELNIQADNEALYWIAREATGSVRDAYTLFDQVAAFSDGHITFEKIHEKLGLTGVDSINKLVSACVAKSGQEALNILNDILQNGISVEQVVSDCADYFRSLLLVKHGITKEALIGQRADRFPKEVLAGWDAVQIERALSIMLQLFKDLRFSVDPRYELELAVSRLAWLSDYVSPQELKTAFDAARDLLAANANGSTQIHSKLNEYNAARQDGGGNQSFSEADSLTGRFKAFLQKENAANKQGGSSFKNSEEGKQAEHSVQSYQTVRTIKNTFENSLPKNDASVQSNIVQTQTAFTPQYIQTAETNNFSIGDLNGLKNKTVELLSKKNGLLSSALGQSKDWTVKNETLFMIAKSAFDISLLQKHIDILRDTVEQLTGTKYRIAIKEFIPPEQNITEEEKKETAEKHPELILMIEDIFMGKVVEKKKSVFATNENDTAESFTAENEVV